MKIFVLSKENIELAKHEVLALTQKKEFELYDDLLIINLNQDFHDRLGYTHEIYELLFTSNKKNIEKDVKNFNWNKIYKENFYVKSSEPDSLKKLSSMIYDNLKNPVVKVKNSKTTIKFFYRRNQIFVALFLNKVDKSFLKRKAHLRPELHPTSLHPGLARACINLTGLTKGKLLDPFCGSGGILVEAALMGFKVKGSDLEKDQVRRAKINFEYFNIKGIIEEKNALSIKKKYDCIVTDVPYGKNSKAKDIENLYLDFLKNSEKITKIIVIIFPDFINAQQIILKTKWTIKNKFSSYVHKSMTRNIFTLVQVSH